MNHRSHLCLVPLLVAVALPLPAEAAPAPARWAVGGSGGWDYLSVDASAGRLYVSRSDRVIVLDTHSGATVGTIADTAGVHGIAIDLRHGKGYTSNGRGDDVTEFDLASLAVTRRIPVSGHNPDAIVVDAPSGHVFTFNGKSHDASVIDPASASVVATIALDGKPEFAVSDGHGRIFVNDEDHGTIDVIDTRSNRRVATWSLAGCEEPSGLAFDAGHARLFSVCANRQLSVTDARNGRHVASVAIGSGPDAVAFDPSRNAIYSSNGADGTLSVIHADGGDRYRVVATVPTQTSARTLALDPATQRVFLAAAAFEPLPAGNADPKARPPMTPDSFVILVLAADALAAGAAH